MKININRDFLYDEYIIKKKSTTTIGEEIGVNRNTVWSRLVDYNIPRRNKSTMQLKELNHQWKGDDAGLSSIHEHMRKIKPIPEFCGICKEKKKLELMCIDHNYTRNPDDYMYACRSCHMKEDFKRGLR